MKRVALMKQLKRIARDKGVKCEMVREGKEHEIWKVGTRQVSVPRHREINELTAQSILDDAQEG